MCDAIEWDVLWPSTGPLLWIGCEDVITCRTEDTGLAPDEVEFQLRFVEADLSWWKGIRVVTRGDFWHPEVQLGTSEVQDSQRIGAVLRFNLNDVQPHLLQIWKAKFLGTHTCMYQLELAAMPPSFNGRRVVLGWYRDNGPRGSDAPCP